MTWFDDKQTPMPPAKASSPTPGIISQTASGMREPLSQRATRNQRRGLERRWSGQELSHRFGIVFAASEQCQVFHEPILVPGIEHQSQAFAGDWRGYLVVGFSS